MVPSLSGIGGDGMCMRNPLFELHLASMQPVKLKLMCTSLF